MSTRLVLDRDFSTAEVNPRLFGSFVEHMGRCVYTGIFEPDHPAADEAGLRTDVLDLVRELGVTTVRYPGGNFVSGYRWEDGVGPRESRPRRADLAWHSTETNQFGLHEFMSWTAKAGIEPMMAINLGTRGLPEALDLLEYATLPGGTALADQRRANGAEAPFDVRMWCLGNEMDGPWQVGHKTAGEYGRLAAETARAMLLIQPDLELVACGSSGSSMPTFGAWESEVLEHTYDLVSHVSCHAYYQEVDGDAASFLASGADMDHFIDSVVATADAVGARLRLPKRIQLSFDEWNVWYQTRHAEEYHPTDWPVAPRVIEDTYSATDAVVVGGLLIALLRHADRVTSASMAQLVNVIAPIRSEPGGPSWRQTIFHPFALTARHATGRVLRVTPVGESVATDRFGDVSQADAVATHDEASGETSVFVVNRSPDAPLDLEVAVRGVGATRVVQALVLHEDDRHAVNTQAEPDRVVPRPLEGVELSDGLLRLRLPACAWAVVRLAQA